MLTRLALKEVRENIWIAAAAMAVYLYFVMMLTGIGLGAVVDIGRGGIVPFVQTDLVMIFAMVGMCLASGLGLRQTVGESARGTFQFLLHRPAGRNQILATKLLTGAVLYLGCSALPILLYAWWAATPGSHASPFEWSMTFMAWKVWTAGTVVYLGAFLAGIRPGRWHGTRLLPLITTGALALVLPHLPWWSLTGLPAMVILDVLLVANIFYVARTRDFS
jgi:hypothetical protein